MKGILFILAACTIWAIDTLFRYPLLGQGVSPLRIVFSEHLLLTVIFIPVLIKHWDKVWQTKVSHLFYFLVIGGGGSAVATLAFTKAFSIINPSLVILLQKFQPLVAILLARIVIGEKIGRNFSIWAAVCVIGGFLVAYQDIFPGLASLDFSSKLLDQKNLYGYLLTLLAVLGWGGSTVFGKKLSLEGFSEIEIMAGRFVFGFVCLLPFVQYSELISGANVYQVSGTIALMVLFTGVGSMYLYYQGLKRISARLCTLVEMFFPFCAVIINWIFLGAQLDFTQIIGGIMLLVGATVIQLMRF
ncbi:MAG: DMT family transporter [Bacteriovoracaceae bacterium]|nr:DMT family transporter [Bacteriovoracaceae bacterium]